MTVPQPSPTRLLLHLNQITIRAGLEELSLWTKQRGSTNVHDNVLSIMHTLDSNAEAIASGIEFLRSTDMRPEGSAASSTTL